MTRETRRRQADRLLATRLLASEEILGCGVAWVARVRPGRHLLFTGRHRQLLVLTDQRLVTFRRTRGDAAPSLDLALTRLRLTDEHPAKPFFQLLVGAGDESVALELRHRDHAFARALARALGAHAEPAAVAPPTTG